ncbi:hypothetical protein HY522_03795 [bacterium]|nr:hypothetical protein [bacterium]
MIRPGAIEFLANLLLFLSALVLIVDIAPRDFLPSHKARARAIEVLKAKRNVLGPMPQGVAVVPETAGMQVGTDFETYRVLVEMIRENSPLAKDVEWGSAVGVGYAALSLPVGNNKLEAFRPLYVALSPAGEATVLRLIPVGQLHDLDAWIGRWHQGSLTKTALALLALGFALQLIRPFFK